jgi:hypothetical protein
MKMSGEWHDAFYDFKKSLMKEFNGKAGETVIHGMGFGADETGPAVRVHMTREPTAAEQADFPTEFRDLPIRRIIEPRPYGS